MLCSSSSFTPTIYSTNHKYNLDRSDMNPGLHTSISEHFLETQATKSPSCQLHHDTSPPPTSLTQIMSCRGNTSALLRLHTRLILVFLTVPHLVIPSLALIPSCLPPKTSCILADLLVLCVAYVVTGLSFCCLCSGFFPVFA